MKNNDFLQFKDSDGKTITVNKKAINSIVDYKDHVMIYMLKDQGYTDLIFHTTIDYKVLMQQIYDQGD